VRHAIERRELGFVLGVTWISKVAQRGDHAGSIRARGFDPDVEVTCVARSTVNGQRVRADDEEANAMSFQ
jgi:hypothetical protein